MGAYVELGDLRLAMNPDPTCLDCVRKHLAAADVLMDEARQGYPEHRWRAIGNLVEAARESAVRFPELAAQIRAQRLKLEKNPRHLVPFLGLIEDASRLAQAER